MSCRPYGGRRPAKVSCSCGGWGPVNTAREREEPEMVEEGAKVAFEDIRVKLL
jgi:hypothetical protein